MSQPRIISSRTVTRPATAAATPLVKPKKHPGVKPSLINSLPCTTSGSRSLDRTLGHGGVLLGSVTLVEEHGNTDYSSALSQCLCTTSVNESRHQNPSKIICLGMGGSMDKLPAIYEGKNKKIKSEALPEPHRPNLKPDMKIAWRYAKYANQETDDKPTDFCPDVDFKKHLSPPAQGSEIAYVEIKNDNPSSDIFASILSKVERILSSAPKQTLVRIVAPQFLHPLLYPVQVASSPRPLLTFIANLKKVVSGYGNAAAFITIPLHLYPRSNPTIAAAELICDTCVELEHFESIDDSTHGFLHINRIAALSDRGEMVERKRELTFRLEKHQLEVVPYSIPVDPSELKEDIPTVKVPNIIKHKSNKKTEDTGSEYSPQKTVTEFQIKETGDKSLSELQKDW